MTRKNGEKMPKIKKRKIIYFVFTTDAWLSHKSKCLTNAFENKEKALKFIKNDAKKYGDDLSKNDITNLLLINQTQGRNENYLIETQIIH